MRRIDVLVQGATPPHERPNERLELLDHVVSASGPVHFPVTADHEQTTRGSPAAGLGAKRQYPAGAGRGRTRPRVAITLGDPAGIGPEIVWKALQDNDLRVAAEWVLIGPKASIEALNGRCGTESRKAIAPPNQLPGVTSDGHVCFDDVPMHAGELPALPTDSAEGGRVSFLAIERAIERAKLPETDPEHVDAIVTAPISKTSWDMARRAASADARARFRASEEGGDGSGGGGGGGFPGHTELLADRFQSPRSGMLFVGPSMRVMLTTIHVPLSRVTSVLTAQRVADAIVLAHEACLELGVGAGTSPRAPRLAVCGVNPHAGEHGLLGTEDDAVIVPGIAMARARIDNESPVRGARAHDISGPLPADTLFAKARLNNGRRVREDGYDCVVAMYHDQGLIPMKLLDPHACVNVTVGLRWPRANDPAGRAAPSVPSRSIIRTSPAHGTAFDIAGRVGADGLPLADASSMQHAMLLALQMVERRRSRAAELGGATPRAGDGSRA